MTSTLHDAIAAARAGDTERAQLIAATFVQNHPDDPNAWYLMSQLVDSDARRAAYLSKTLSLAPEHPRAAAEYAALTAQPVAVPADEIPSFIASAIDEAADADLIDEIPPFAAEFEEEVVVVEEFVGDVPEEIPPFLIETAEAEDEAEDEDQATPIVAQPLVETIVVEEAATAPVLEIEPPLITATDLSPAAISEAADRAVAAAEARKRQAEAGQAPEWLQPLGPQAVPAARPAPRAAVPPAAVPPAAQPTVHATGTVQARRAPARKNHGDQALTVLLAILSLLTILALGLLLYLLIG